MLYFWKKTCRSGMTIFGALKVFTISILFFLSQVGEFRAHAAEWTANVSAEFKETRRRLSVDIYDKFQRAASIKRKLSAEIYLSPPVNQQMTPGKRAHSVNLGDEREAYSYTSVRNGSLFLNGLIPDYTDHRDNNKIQTK